MSSVLSYWVFLKQGTHRMYLFLVLVLGLDKGKREES
jgi:hypothetical protein